MKKSMLVALLVAGISANSSAAITWDWSFNAERGQFITDGTTPVPGTYTLVDFVVTASGAVAASGSGGRLGSLSGGVYQTGPRAFETDEPFSFVWDGSRVTLWLHSGRNLFDWWAFADTFYTNQFYLFGWDAGNINNPFRAALWDSVIPDPDLNAPSVGDIRVVPSAVPEPGMAALLCLGFISLLATRSRWWS
jgi:hypothetical protein